MSVLSIHILYIYAQHSGYALIQLPEALLCIYMRLKRRGKKFSQLDRRVGKEQPIRSNEMRSTRNKFVESSNVRSKYKLGVVAGYKQRKAAKNAILKKFITKTFREVLKDRREQVEQHI